MTNAATDDPWETAQDELAQANLGDGLPLVPPTPERIERMLAPHRFDRNEVVAMLPPVFGEATWEAIARNAVMAGCRPEYLPVVGAAVEAITAPEFNLIGISTTTGSASTLVIVNGPVVEAIGMNAAGNALGPGNRANATIGRALRLTLQNVGGATPGELDMATLGQPGKYTFCFAENEAASPWLPLHLNRGFTRNESVVTVVGAAGNVEVVDSASRTAEGLIRTFVESMLIAGTIGGGGVLGGGEPLLVIPPELAQIFVRDGYTKQRVKAAIFERAMLPLERLSAEVREHFIERRKIAGVADPEAPARLAERAEDLMLVVAGGVGIKAAYVPTWGGGTKAVSRRVRGGGR
jgi:hypothetical protein